MGAIDEEIDEVPLEGGWTAAKVFRIGAMVHRSMGERAPFVHRLLEYLEEIGFEGVPRFRGVDRQGREVLTYLEGEMGHRWEPASWSDEQLGQVAAFMRRFHDATAGTTLAGGGEVVCHNDFAPWNAVLAGGEPVGLIDFDDAAPGARVRDLSYAFWCWLDIGGVSREPRELARRLWLMCAAYGTADAEWVVPEILERMRENYVRRMGRGKAEEAERVAAGIEWLEGHRVQVRHWLVEWGNAAAPSGRTARRLGT
jgi:hypothetical protein